MRRSFVLLVGLGVAASALAYVPTGDDWTWQGTPISDPFLVNPSSFPPSAGSDTAIRNRIAEAMDVWGTQGGADFRFVDGGDTTATSWDPADAQNILQWHPTTTSPAAVALAQTWVAPPNQTVECDIRFYGTNGVGPITWSSKAVGANPGEMDIGKIAVHELGHCLGLNHSADPNAIMFATTVDGTPAAERALGADDIAGLQAIYGVLTADVVVAGSSVLDLSDGDGVHEPGDFLDLTLDAENIGDVLAPDVTATITSPEPVLRVVTDTTSFGDIGVGAVSTGSPDVRLRVRTWCTVDTTVDLDVRFEDSSGETWSDTVAVDVDCAVTDDDGDGYDISVDCDDADPAIHPDATEVCDGADNDCDGQSDEGWTPDGSFYYRDADVDGFGDPAVRRRRCAPPPGFVDDDQDCDDGDDAIYPGAPELCDGIDQDCDGAIDNGGTGGPWYDDADGDGFGDPSVVLTSCTQPPGTSTTATDCDDGDDGIYPGAPERCNGLDDDCNGVVPATESDGDGDSVRSCDGDCDDTDPDVAPGATELCNGDDDDCDGAVPAGEVDQDGDGSAACEGDCDDSDGSVHPSATESCNGIDDDCDGALSASELDNDGDGVTACDGDCDDADPSRLPGAIEACNGIDDDCSGTLGAPEADADNDGVMACMGDCDDSEPTVHSGATEVCDGLDNDCDLNVDNVGSLTVYDDDDGDGFGAPGTAVTIGSCASLAGRVDNDADCDDSDAAVHPGAVEIPDDGIDQDCDPSNDISTDPGDTGAPDDTGSPDTGSTEPDTASPCDVDGDGFVSQDCGGDDCDDGNDRVHPGASEYLDERDNDCDGIVDNNGLRDTGADSDELGSRAACNCDASTPQAPWTWAWMLPLALATLRRRRSIVDSGAPAAAAK